MMENKVILITGSSRGIGAATAMRAKEYGARVVLHGRTESDELVKLSKSLNAPMYFVTFPMRRRLAKRYAGQ